MTTLSSMNFTKYEDVLEYIPNPQQDKQENNFDTELLVKSIKNNVKNIKSTTMVISLSGGVDSMVLTYILKALGYNVYGIHINYNNRPETVKEAEFIKEWCDKNMINLIYHEITDLKRSEMRRNQYEEQTKNIRFDLYRKTLEKINSETSLLSSTAIPQTLFGSLFSKLSTTHTNTPTPSNTITTQTNTSTKHIILGHHKDDIVENIFNNVCRGRTIMDLTVFKMETDMFGIRLFRPMLDVHKSVIYQFAEKYQVPYFKDTTPDWSLRGTFRKQALPLLEKTYTNFVQNMLNISRQSNEWNELVEDKIIEPFLQTIQYNPPLPNAYLSNPHNYPNVLMFDFQDHQFSPMCFWATILQHIFHRFDKPAPSRKATQIFMNYLDYSEHRTTISISQHCTTIVFKWSIIISFP